MGTAEDKPSSVLLVREWEQQLSSSGCCGRIEGDFLDFSDEGERVFSDRRTDMECAGALYRALRERYGSQLQVHIVDPRNLLSLIPRLLRDAWRHGRSPREILRTLFGLGVNAVIVDGRLVSRDEWPQPEALFRLLDERQPGRSAAVE